MSPVFADDFFWSKLESTDLRRAISTPMLRESPQHRTYERKSTKKSRQKLDRALEVAVKIAVQLEANTADLLKSVEEHKQRVCASFGQRTDLHSEDEP